jgi:hypothetical protein
MKITGSGLPSTEDPGPILRHLVSPRPSWLYHLIIFSVCRQDIIGYTTVTSIETGGRGVIAGTGTGRVGIEIIPSIIGVVKIFIGHQQVIMAISIVAEMFTVVELVVESNLVTKVEGLEEIK